MVYVYSERDNLYLIYIHTQQRRVLTDNNIRHSEKIVRKSSSVTVDTDVMRTSRFPVLGCVTSNSSTFSRLQQ
jgi:hypothetical protein